MLEPLSEYVKIEPQHLGVGQYQHDIAQKKLSTRLEDTVSEAVSFTGKLSWIFNEVSKNLKKTWKKLFWVVII